MGIVSREWKGCLDDEPAVRRRYEAARKRRLKLKEANLSIIKEDY